jgi:hypothetical protein
MKALLLTTAVIEVGAGLALLGWPTVFAKMLYAAPIEGAVPLSIARIGGMGLLSLGIAAWLSSPGPARGLVGGLVLYNIGAAVIFGMTALGSAPIGVGLWPVVILHAIMAVWCVSQLLRPFTKLL